MEVLSLAAAEKKLDMVMRIAPDTPRYVVGDEKRIRQVLLNLMVIYYLECTFIKLYNREMQ